MLTAFLAALWGPTLLAIGIGFLVSSRYYKQLYRNLEKESLSLLTLAMVLIPLGIVQVTFHNSWNGLLEGVVSFLGWATLVKGIAIAIFPKLADKAGDFEAKKGLLPFAGILMVIVGGYLTWAVFL